MVLVRVNLSLMGQIRLLHCILLLLAGMPGNAKPGSDGLLVELNRAIARTATYDAQKRERIEQARRALDAAGAPSLPAQYDVYLKLYEEYKIFRFDTAFLYTEKLEQLAAALRDPSRQAQARMKRAFVLVSAGLFREAGEVILPIAVAGLPDSLKAEYYFLKGRYYYDLADYTSDAFYAPDYLRKGSESLDSALAFFPPTAFEAVYYRGLMEMKKGQTEKAYAYLQPLVNRPGVTLHQLALVSSTLSYIYLVRGENRTAIDYQVRAALADIRSSTKETFATLNLAQLLFEQGDFNNAASYIKKAVEDASFYGARQRKVQLSAIMPIIQSSQMNYMEHQRRSWIIYGAVVSCILILLTFLIIVIYRQNRKLEQARKTISEAHNQLSGAHAQLQVVNTELQKVNNELSEVNAKLLEANKIKEEYIGYFFTINSGLFQKIERLKKALEQKISERKLDEARFIVQGINIHQEKEELLRSFDKAFLKLFPHFVDEFNALFREEDQVRLSDHELLNTDLRIYALIRLGIKENEKIAEILEYSIKSIYAYKTKIRNRANVPKEEFDRRVMSIKSI